LVTLLAVATLSGGIAALLRQQRSELHEVLYTLAAALLLLTALVQANIAWRQLPLRRRQKQAVLLANCPAISRRMLAARLAVRLFAGLVICYLVALATGPGATAPYVFAAGAMAWLTVLLLPFTAHPATIDRWRRILQGYGPRRFARFLYVVLLVGVVGELSLRAGQWLWEPAFLDAPEPVDATLVNSHAVESVMPLSSGQQITTSSAAWSGFRVAVMGDEIALAAANPHGALAQLESALPAIKVFNVSAPQAGPREYASQGIQQARRCQPDLVLTFVSIADDIVGEPQQPSLFDWRSLCTARLVLRCAGLPIEKGSGNLGPPQREASLSADDWDAYVAACGPQLIVCRKPINATMQQRWKTTLRYLDDLAESCRRADIPLALVIVPSPLQTNRPLLDAVCRRQGCGPTDVDVELPQRRLAAYAAERKVPLFDLLPALRTCPEQPYVHQGWHWNEAGNEVAAQALTSWLQSTFATTLAARRPDLGPLSSADDDASWLLARRQ
jgi:hypothetical protein